MKPHPKLRKTIKWGGLAVTVLLVVVWVGSGWGTLYYRYDLGRRDVGLTSGVFGVNRFNIPDATAKASPDAQSRGAWRASPSWSIRLWPEFGNWRIMFSWRFDTRGPIQEFATVPLWMPTLLLAIPTGIAWRLDTLARRRAQLNLCPKCNYDRTGLALDAVCPECGAQDGGNAARNNS